jgi:hypothetical protein
LAVELIDFFVVGFDMTGCIEVALEESLVCHPAGLLY